VFGTSSGAALALEAAASGLAVTRLALWEPPFVVDGSRPRPPADAAATYEKLVSAGRRGDAVEFFMAKVVGMPAVFVAEARNAPWWLAQEAMAHTLAYDAVIMGDHSVPSERVAAVAAPALVIDGAASPAWMHTAARAVANLLPAGRYHTLEGQQHNVAVEALGPVLEAFFAGRNGTRP
jgi:pimeloyl-ACP methyl ester carboxylesterase